MPVLWNRFIILFSIGVILCLLGGLLFPIFPLILHAVLKEKFVLSPNSETFKQWQKPDVEIFLQFYLFNISNPMEFSGGEKAVLQQRGPYTYREVREKFNLTWNEDGTVSYRNKFLYYFQKNMSVGPEDDIIFYINIPLIATVDKLQSMTGAERYIGDRIVADYEEEEPLVPNRTVKELIWGYVDPIMHLFHLFHIIPDDHFGLFYNRNDTDDGIYSVFTGEYDLNLFGTVFTWNQSRTLNYWTTSFCNMVNGTDGSIFHPLIKKTETLYIFSTDLCRSIYCQFNHEVSVDNILAYKFSAPESVFANVSVNPDNIGFCTPNCLGSGVLNISNCKEGAPIVLSSPHFYMGDPEFVHGVVGLHPNQEEHETFMYIEPTSGLILKAMKRLQVNIAVKNYSLYNQLKNVRPVILPVVWINESMELDQNDRNMIKNQMLIPINAVYFLELALITAGMLILISLLIYLIITIRSKNSYESSPILYDTDCNCQDDTRNNESQAYISD